MGYVERSPYDDLTHDTNAVCLMVWCLECVGGLLVGLAIGAWWVPLLVVTIDMMFIWGAFRFLFWLFERA